MNATRRETNWPEDGTIVRPTGMAGGAWRGNAIFTYKERDGKLCPCIVQDDEIKLWVGDSRAFNVVDQAA